MSLRTCTLAEIKANARIEENTEDAVITALGEAAEATVFNLMERSYDDVVVEHGSIPAPVKQAVLMLSTHLWEHRGIVNPTALYNIPYTIDCLIKPYIRFNYRR